MQPSRTGSSSDSSSTQTSVKQDHNGDDDSESTDIEEENSESGEGGFSPLNMGISCIVCKNSNTSKSNQLVECQECHSLYHQNCHRPPITEHNINDPRVVWYCVKCAKSLKKVASKNGKSTATVMSGQTNSTSVSGNSSPNKSGTTLTNSASFASAANQGRETALQLLKAKAEKSETTTTAIQPFKRIESKTSTAGP